MADDSSSVGGAVRAINLAVTGIAGGGGTGVGGGVGGAGAASGGGGSGHGVMRAAAPGGGEGETSTVPYDQALGLAVQSIAQSAAIAVSDATDMLRNVETVMTTAMGVAMAKWIETPENVFYEQIVNAASNAIKTSAENFKTIGTDAEAVLAEFKPGA